MQITLFGRKLLTDHLPLQYVMENIMTGDPAHSHAALEEFDKLFPGFREAAIECIKDLDRKRLRATTITYFCFRVQAWAEGFDANPSDFRRVLPEGVVTFDSPVVH